jgi:hypothetical protein
MKQLDAWRDHVSWCLDAGIGTAACKPFWTWAMVAAVAIGLLILWTLLARLLRPFLIWIAELRLRARDRKIADTETMARYKVDDSKLHSGPAQENVEQRIRDALLERRVTDQQQRHRRRTGDKKP